MSQALQNLQNWQQSTPSDRRMSLIPTGGQSPTGPQPVPQSVTAPVVQPTAPTPQTGAVVSDTAARQQVQTAEQQLQEAMRMAQQIQEGINRLAEQQRQPQPTDTGPLAPAQQPADEIAGSLQDLTGQQMSQINNEIDQFNQALEARKMAMDAQHQATISQIQASYDRLRNIETEQTQARMQGLEILGIRSGRARYAGEVHQSVLSAEQSRHMQRLSELEAEENRLILEAQMARNEEEWEIFVQSMNFVQQARREKMQTVQQMYELAIAQENQAIARAREERSQIEFETNMLLQARDVAFQDFDMMIEAGRAPTEEELLRISRETGLMPDILEGLYNERRRELGEAQLDRALQRQLTQSQINASNLRNTQIQNELKEMAEARAVQTFMGGSLSPVEWAKTPAGRSIIEDEIRRTGQIPTRDRALELYDEHYVRAVDANNSLINAAANIFPRLGSVHAQKQAEDHLNSLISRGEMDAAATYLKAQAVAGTDVITQRQYTGYVKSILTLEEVRELMLDYTNQGGNLGRLSSTIERSVNRTGRTIDPDLTNIENRIKIAVLDYRDTAQGARFSNEELARYDEIFPAINAKLNLNLVTIDSLISAMRTNQEGIYMSVMGAENYLRLFGNRGLSDGPIAPTKGSVGGNNWILID